MENILYLDDYINFYNGKENKLIVIKPYKNTLKNGLIINSNKFIKNFNKMLDEHKLRKNIFSENIIIIINNLFNNIQKEQIKVIMEELNYKNIKFIHETDYLKINKNIIYINCNNTYFYLTYTNNLGNIEFKIYENDNISKKILSNIISLLNKKNIILYGKNILEIKSILDKDKIESYIFEETDNLLIKLLLNDKKVSRN